MAIGYDENFINAVNKWKKMRARFDQRQVLKHEFELLVRFDEETYPIWGLYQQSTVGNINVPKMDYMDPREESWMWSWIHGNRKWHAWNKCKGLSKEKARHMFINEVKSLEARLPDLIDAWKDEQDPRIPDETVIVPDEEKAERERIIKDAKAARRARDAEKRNEEVAKGWWNED